MTLHTLSQKTKEERYKDHSCVSVFDGGKTHPHYCGHCREWFVSHKGVTMTSTIRPYRDPLGRWCFQ